MGNNPRQLLEYYPEDEYDLTELTKIEDVKNYLESKSSACWCQGPLAETNYYKLAQFSPTNNRKAHIFYCNIKLINKIKAKKK